MPRRTNVRHQINVIDLSGAYRLMANSAKNFVVRSLQLENGPRWVIDIVHAYNLDRNYCA